MNAPIPPDAIAVAKLPVAAIVPSPSNPRKRFNEEYIAGLAESIKTHGLIQPITVRPLPLDALFAYNHRNPKRADPFDVPTYEIVVGECRWRAAKLAGLTEIPAFWRELGDKQVLEIQVIENLQRRDVHELEEAEGYEQLIQHHGYTADTLAAKIGKSRAYVYARLKLLALGNEGREAFSRGELEASVALLISRIPPSLQKKALGIVLQGYDGHPLSYRTAKQALQSKFTINLKQATFSLDDTTLVTAAGSCTACPKRAGNDLVMTAEGIDADVCTDTDCFNEKRQSRRAQLIAKAEKLKIPVLTGNEAVTAYYHDDTRINIDDVVDGDGQERTYRQILGDNLPRLVALVEVGQTEHNKKMVEMADATAMEKALKKAGWTPDLFQEAPNTPTAAEIKQRREEEAARQAKYEAEQAAIAAENSYRGQLADTVIERIRTLGDSGAVSFNTDEAITLLAIAWVRFDLHFNGTLEDQLLARHGITVEGDLDEQDVREGVLARMRQWPVGTALAFLFDMLTSQERRTVQYWNFNPEIKPLTLLDLASLVAFDAETLRTPAPTPSQAAQANDEGATKPAAPAETKGKKAAAKKPKAKADPAPTMSANEPAAPVENPGLASPSAWPFPVKAAA
jgi:ParB/RepB/Spo0J family partition protein